MNLNVAPESAAIALFHQREEVIAVVLFAWVPISVQPPLAGAPWSILSFPIMEAIKISSAEQAGATTSTKAFALSTPIAVLAATNATAIIYKTALSARFITLLNKELLLHLPNFTALILTK